MRIKLIIIYYLRYAWHIVKIFLGVFKSLFTGLLPFTGLTIVLSFIQGLILGPWYHATTVDQMHFLLENMINVQTGEWLKMPGGQNPLYYSRAPYYIPQLHNPLTWAKDIGIRRPDGWHTENAGKLTEFRNLYRARRRYTGDPSWHHWIYLSKNKQPLNETWNEDPWDKAFQELLEYRDKHEPLGRSNFDYITCPQNFLCSFWQISGPALVHFTNEPMNKSLSDRRSRKPILDPVSVRVFEFPLQKPVVPGVFPTRFEQMRSITASNSTYWTTRTTYSNFEQVSGQARKVLKEYEEKYPMTYGMLAKAEHKLVRLIGSEDTIMHLIPQVVSFLAAAVPSRYGADAWRKAQIWWKKRQYEKSTRGNVQQREADEAASDPVAFQLQYILDTMTDEDKEKFGKTHRGEVLLNRLQNALDKKDWDGREDIIKQLEDAFVP